MESLNQIEDISLSHERIFGAFLLVLPKWDGVGHVGGQSLTPNSDN